MDFLSYARFALALVFVLALIGVLTALARRFGVGGLAHPRRAGERRLGIVEVLAVDGKRRLVLVRRDQTEHLLLIGGETDLVIERAASPRPETPRPDFKAALATAANPDTMPGALPGSGA